MIKIVVPFLWIDGITLFPFVLFKTKTLANNKIVVNHEKIHIRQQLELLIIPFYIWYVVEGIFKKYRDISFEKEAYQNERDMDYLKKRKFWQFINYIK